MNLAYLALNTRKPPLNNIQVRRAIALAINYQRLMQAIYYGTAETAPSILPRASWAYGAHKSPNTIQTKREKSYSNWVLSKWNSVYGSPPHHTLITLVR